MGTIWLNSSEEALFSPQASVLNRLITAYLYNKKRFLLVDKPGRIEEPVKTLKGYVIRFEGYDLRLMSSVNDARDIPSEGKNLIVVAAVNQLLHFRIFDREGKIAADTDETRLTERVGLIEGLRTQLASLWPRPKLTASEKGKVIDAVASIVGHTRFEGRTGKPMKVDQAIIRHGPKPALAQGFPDIWAACEPLRAEWRPDRQDEDWTRKRLYSTEDFEAALGKIPPLRLDFAGRIGCVLVKGRGDPPGEMTQEERVTQALEKLKKRLGSRTVAGPEIETVPEVILATEALATSAAYERTVRALCECDLAVFDITGLDCAVMLFLGIRSAVRRGVTITLTNDEPGGNPLPFNLASLIPIRTRKEEIKQIANALEAGYDALRLQPDAYLDLPAFDAVRRLGETPGIREPEEQVLLLQWFDPDHGKKVNETLKGKLEGRFGEATRLVSRLDCASPQLVEQRLYPAIRCTRVCIADWTGWRPNVFFEIGVRLAVNDTDPIFIFYSDDPDGDPAKAVELDGDPARRALFDFFKPTRFSLKELKNLKDRLAEFDPNQPSLGTGATLSPGAPTRWSPTPSNGAESRGDDPSRSSS